MALQYCDSSSLTHVGVNVVGRDGITQKLIEVSKMYQAFGKVKHEVIKVDAQPVIHDALDTSTDARGCLLVVVSGQLTMQGPATRSRPIAESFFETFALEVLGSDGVPRAVSELSSGKPHSVVVHLQIMRLV